MSGEPDKRGDTPQSPARRRALGMGIGTLMAIPAAEALAQAPVQDAMGHAPDAKAADAPISLRTQDRVEFRGVHQAGVTTPRPTAGMIASFDVLVQSNADLEGLFRTLTKRIAFLTVGGPQTELDPRLPPAESGILGPVIQPDGLTMTVSVGASLFTGELGLARLKPRQLQQLHDQPNDTLDQSL